MQYHQPRSYSHDEINKIISSNDSNEVCFMLVGVAYYERNLEYAYNLISQFISHDDLEISTLAISCLADVARVHDGLPIEKTINLLEEIIIGPNGSNEEIKNNVLWVVSELTVFQPEISNALLEKLPKYFEGVEF